MTKTASITDTEIRNSRSFTRIKYLDSPEIDWGRSQTQLVFAVAVLFHSPNKFVVKQNSASSLTAAASATLRISKEELRRLMSQIEAQLYHSQVYRRTLANLQTMQGVATDSSQMLLKAVAREAIWLALQQFVSQYQAAGAATASQAKAWQLSPPSLPGSETGAEGVPLPGRQGIQRTDKTPDRAIPNPAVKSTDCPAPPTAVKGQHQVTTGPSQKSTQSELTAPTDQQRSQCLRQIGEQLRLARIARSLNLTQLQSQTHIPLHHIEALEAGRVEELPEDVYVRGFICRLGDVLGLDGAALVAALPAPEPLKSVLLPSAYQPEYKASRFYLTPTHLYLGYTALVAGAVGGLAWISQQSPKDVIYEPESFLPSQLNASVQEADRSSVPGLKSSQNGVVAGRDLAPPESLSTF